jgi:superfamily II DNA/RNA helicase
VRAAFNSPFWPFVLVSTSVGQEGLDFHHYCHAITHWNLPSNPVDLEQREGRIHRYKGHAVRKNVAAAFATEALSHRDSDAWETAFELGRTGRSVQENDLVPYWLFPGNAKIERHVPALPFSREVERLNSLRRALAIYRMVFGQSRQEDLIAYLLAQIPEGNRAEIMAELQIDLSPAKRLEEADSELAKTGGRG